MEQKMELEALKEAPEAKMFAEAIGSNGCRILSTPKLRQYIAKTIIVKYSDAGILGEMYWLNKDDEMLAWHMGPLNDSYPQIGEVFVELKVKNNIRKLRKLRGGMSLLQLSKDSGVPYSTLNDWENGKRIPRDVYQLKKLADALEVKIEDLIIWE